MNFVLLMMIVMGFGGYSLLDSNSTKYWEDYGGLYILRSDEFVEGYLHETRGELIPFRGKARELTHEEMAELAKIPANLNEFGNYISGVLTIIGIIIFNFFDSNSVIWLSSGLYMLSYIIPMLYKAASALDILTNLKNITNYQATVWYFLYYAKTYTSRRVIFDRVMILLAFLVYVEYWPLLIFSLIHLGIHRANEVAAEFLAKKGIEYQEEHNI